MATATQSPESHIKNRYAELSQERNKYRDRAREYAKVTLPYLLPEQEGDRSGIEFQNDYNTEGAKLVNALANKYMETLFPAGRSFIKFNLEEEDMSALTDAGNEESDIKATLAKAERQFRIRFESIGSRPSLLDMFKHLIVTGNALLYKPMDGMLMTYAIDEYVVARSLDGTTLEMITIDTKVISTLEPDLQVAVMSALKIKEEDKTKTPVNLYTYVRRDSENQENWIVEQAVEDFPVGEINTYDSDSLRWLAVGWTRTRREQYFRGLVEEHFGSFWTMSILTEALASGCVTIADVKHFVRPGSMIDIQAVNSSPSGSYHYGEPDDISSTSTDRARDMSLIKDVINDYRRHLGEVFMYQPAAMRDGERVTAEEVRIRARELENAHGGVYSSLADTLQRPLAKAILSEMGLKQLETSGINLVITSGLDALSRGNDNEKINAWLFDLQNTNQLAEDVRGRFKMSSFMQVTAAGRDVNYSEFLLSDQEFEQAQAQAQDAQAQREAMVKSAGPGQAPGQAQQM